MARTFELGHWDSTDQLTDRLHEYFERSGLTDWLQIAERADGLREHYSLLARPVLYAACAQAWEGALFDFACRANIHSTAFLELMRDVRENTVRDFPASFLQLIAHGPIQCDHSECWVCNGGPRE